MKKGGRIPWNVTAICEVFKISCLMGRRPMKDVLGNHLKDLLFHLVHWLNIILFPRKTSRESINLVRKYFLEYSSTMSCMPDIIWKRDFLVVDLEELEEMDASESMLKRLNAKEVITPKSEKHIFPVSDCGGDQELKKSTLTRDHPIRGEGQRDFLGESEGSLPQPHDSFPDAG